ncbi:hypothetical protein HS088_TW03G00812 [Tripterygium wilfordii]|uniref:ENTH/VHS family protein n=1 Tax=Tripterygium wilfordii TaxID=458696 RepID=A0A7J7DVT0_TRIWF|nr:polyadenylation and cleavage factor homolog 4-like [Tripterygium wilfordii]KAF5750475.1 hypothetical protein HS088_TW03G00812 [Tripterygium wilfordii]
MEMESSRRLFDRSRELGVKKPRIEEPNPNGHGRPFLQRPVTPATGPTARYRSADRDSDSNDSNRGGAYHPQPPQQLHQELVTQYKTALAELTFNSKPIITNLTIIAGENLLAAKAITATICAHILEVPSEQKLPSLYLLDSIVKNIGRDYIKYFAARLPEVFIKAFRHVDSPVHQSMRHLFGTWKGVFPPQTLQMIEKELGFTPLVNGSSIGAASRLDSQSQRPPHSTHVNPKYLEKQRLQQSSRAKGMPNDITGGIAGSTEEMEKSDRASTITSRPWADPRIKMQNIQRSQKDALSDSAAYGDFEYSSDLSRPSGLGIGRTSGRVMEQGHDKSLHGSSSSASGTISGQRNGFNAKQWLPSYSSLKSVNVDLHPKPAQSIVGRTSSGLSSSWKNSEEEEFMWEMHSRVADHDIASLSTNSRKDHWAPHDSEKLGYESHLRKPHGAHDVGSKFERENSADSLPNEQKEQATYGHQMLSPWRSQESHSVEGLISSGNRIINSSHSQSYSASFGELATNSGYLSRVGDQQQMGSSHIGALGFGFLGTLAQPRFQPLGGASPSGQSPIHQHPPSPSFPERRGHEQLQSITEQDHQLAQPVPRPDFRASQFTRQLAGNQSTKEPSTVLPSDILHSNLQKSQPQDLRDSSSSDQTQRPPSTIVNSASDHSDPLAANTSGQLSTSCLLAEVMKSGIFSNNAITVNNPNRGSLDTLQVLSKPNIQPPLTRGPTPTSAASDISETKVERPPLSLGPAPSSSQTSDVVSQTPDPISNLLSSLVAKGLISASKMETSTTMSSQTPSQLKGMDSVTVTPISTPVTSVPTSLVASHLSIVDETSVSEPTGNSSDSLPQSSKIRVENTIGLQFKPDLIREMHPNVINELFDDLLHCCSLCGLRLRLREQLDRHLEWHASLKAPEPSGLSRVSRGWYSNSEDWIYGRQRLPLVSDSAVPIEESEEGTDENAALVPADENQCVCVLCGELFEDFFCQERNGWMFKGAVYFTRPLGDGEMETAHERDGNVPIVHEDCMSNNSVPD